MQGNGMDMVTWIGDMGCGMGECYGHSGMDWRHSVVLRTSIDKFSVS